MTVLHLPSRARGADRTLVIERLARESGLHPEIVRRFVRLGLVAPTYSPAAPALLARAMRLRRDLGLDYSGAVLASELLARIDELEARLARPVSDRPHPR